jgi:hypothetical protein
MSGIITGPYFNSFFNQPSHFQLGNMVAILEIGAFSNPFLALRVFKLNSIQLLHWLRVELEISLAGGGPYLLERALSWLEEQGRHSPRTILYLYWGV